MGHTRVKTTYSVEGAYGSTKARTLYCHHNHSSDCITFYDENGDVALMCFEEWEKGNDLWDAMNRLRFPYKGEWGRSDLKDRVELYFETPWKI